MPPKRQSSKGASRSRRQPVRRPVRVQPPTTDIEGVGGGEDAQAITSIPVPTSTPPAVNSGARAAVSRPSARVRPRSRAAAQIVVGNYDFLRHDLRILGVLAPVLVVIMIVSSFVIH